ncbi:MgtC/SapB family protein [Candidatus Woesearchaeota archaeon]|nr:MgtC/SapB family protein [Candidatus Woesearchaeota archaeon]
MEHLIPYFLKLILAAALAGLIGIEREHKHRPAGLRTHMLVCIASTAIIIAALEMSTPDAAGRIAAAIITGIGFLGAGTIISQKKTVHGLTTAASVWAVAGLGIVIGLGHYSLAVATALLFLIILHFKSHKM